MLYLRQAKAKSFFQAQFTSANKTLFKAEVLQDYSAIDSSPSLNAWQRGDAELSHKLAFEDPDINDWISQSFKRKATLTRVHVIEYPLSDYLK